MNKLHINMLGEFSISENTITIDLFAEATKLNEEGQRMVVDALLPTMSHELTHWMEQKSPELYRKLSEKVFSALEKADGLSESDRIRGEIKKALARHT